MTAAIYRGPTRGYKLTDEDTEWLARSLWGECKGGGNPTERNAAAVAWAMIQRFLLVRMKWQWENWTFAGFIRVFSQPVNPRWLPDAPDSLCPAHPERCSPRAIANRHEKQDTPWEKVPARVKELAKAFQEGKLDNPFSEPIYDFFDKTGHGSILIGDNSFYTYKDLSPEVRRLVIPGTVTVERLPWLFLLLAAGALVYIAWRSWRKE